MQNQKISKSFIDLYLIHNFCNAKISYFLLFKLIKYFLLNKERESSINFQIILILLNLLNLQNNIKIKFYYKFLK